MNALARDTVAFDVISWHWYSNMGTTGLLTDWFGELGQSMYARLSSYNKDI